MQGAEEGRLGRMGQYAASLSRASRSNERSERLPASAGRQRRRTCPCESRDDALMVDQGHSIVLAPAEPPIVYGSLGESSSPVH